MTLVASFAGSEAYCAESQRLVFALDAVGHFPRSTPMLTAATETLRLSQMRPIVHEVGITWGVEVEELSSELVLRSGYGFAASELPAGSALGNVPSESYSVSSIPLLLGWRLLLPLDAGKAFVGTDAGGAWSKASFSREGSTPLEIDRRWRWELRALAGVDWPLLGWMSGRLFVEGRIAQQMSVPGAPHIQLGGIGLGIAVVGKLEAPDGKDDRDGLLRDYEPLTQTRLESAFELIRQADAARDRRELIEAELRYRDAISMLPRDDETQRNVGVPVRVDWASVLAQIGRKREARRVLEEALRISPAHQAAQRLRAKLD